MAGDKRLITENFMRLNFGAYAKAGHTPGTDDLIMLDYLNTRTRYNVEITGIAADKQLPSQEQVIPPIGGSYLGGKIAYFLQSGDPGYDSMVTHGIIAADADEATSLSWFTSSLVTGATSQAIGAGITNTNTIVAICGRVYGYAARTCEEKTTNGYTDWCLPSYNEVAKLYLNRVAIGGFTTSSYWTSTEISGTNAYSVRFSDYFWQSSAKTSATKVRAIRYF